MISHKTREKRLGGTQMIRYLGTTKEHRKREEFRGRRIDKKYQDIINSLKEAENEHNPSD